MIFKNLSYRFKSSWRFLVAIITPFALLPIIFIKESEFNDGETTRVETKFETAYVIILMSIYWVLEVIPLPVTSLLPLLFLPMLGVQDAYKVSQNYTKESNMIFLTSVIVALSLEYCNLHRRIAIKVMLIIGASPARLLFGTMLVTSFLAMWISSTTCVAILVPVLIALIDEILESPEIMSPTELRRCSVIPVESLDAQTILDTMRRHSSSSVNRNKSNRHIVNRRRSTVFGNPSLARTKSHETSSLSKPNFRRQQLFPSSSHNMNGQVFHNTHTPNQNQSSPRQISITFEDTVKDGSPRNGGSRENKIYPDMDQRTNGGDINSNGMDVIEENESLSEEESEQSDLPNPKGNSILEERDEEIEKRKQDIKKMYLFAMAYSSNIGGTAIITASSPNKVFKEIIKYVDVSQNGKYLDITFFTWAAFNLPAMIINVFFAWIYLVYYYDGIKNWTKIPFIGWILRVCARVKPDPQEEYLERWKSQAVRTILKAEYEKLGPINFHEIGVGIIFVGVVFLWIFRDPEVFNGWNILIKGASVGDSTGAMVGVLLLFIIPKNLSFFSADKAQSSEYEALLSWKFVSSKMPWGVLLLLGSGFAIADAFEYSGLSRWIGLELESLSQFSRPVLLLTVILLVSILTEVCSNVASVIIMLPIVLTLSRTLGIHPLYLTVPVTVASSYAFMLPVAAPSNALVFAAGNFTTKEMIKIGFFLNVICAVVLFVNTITYGEWLFKFSNYEYKNVTMNEETL